MREIRLGTRTSKLALWQSKTVAQWLEARSPDVRCLLQHMVTQGDRRLDRPLPEIGGKGLFTAELEQALLAHHIDIAVHSLKDLPVDEVPGLTLGAISPRADVRDVLIARKGWTLATLPQGGTVGTSSLRRQAQLAAFRPDLIVLPIRGNVDTRLRKVLDGEYHAAVMAAAGISRLEYEQHVTEWLELDRMLPAPGQGALAVQCRADDMEILSLLFQFDDHTVRRAVSAERQVLQMLGGGCSAPVAAYATVDTAGYIHLRARVAELDGSIVVDAEATDRDADSVAKAVVQALLVQGAEPILARSRRVSPPERPLMGKRIIVTRSAEQATELVTLLESAGAEAILLPVIQTVPLDQSTSTVGEFSAYAWIVFASANAVRYFVDFYPEIRSGNSTNPLIAAVGPATAAALVAYGVGVQEATIAVPDVYTGEHLAQSLGDIQGACILLPRSAIGDETLPNALRAAGATVKELPLYTTIPATPDEQVLAAALAGGPIDITIFTSPSTVRGFVALTERVPQGATLTQDAILASIGPTTTRALMEAGRTVQVTAEVHTVQGLVDAIVAHTRPSG